MVGKSASKYSQYAFGILALLVIVGSIYIVGPFFPALMWATVLTVLAYPLHKRFQKRMPAGWSAFCTTILSILIIGIPLVVVGTLLTVQISKYANDFAGSKPAPVGGWTPDSVAIEIDKAVHPVLEKVGASDFSVAEWFAANKSELSQNLGKSGLKLLGSLGYSLFTLVIAFLTMFFMLKDGHLLLKPALELIPLPEDKSKEILDRMAKTIHAVFIGVVLVSLVQGALAGAAYWFLGVPSPVIWTVATMVLCAVPLLGAPFIYVPMALILLASGKQWQGFTLLAWGFIIVSNADNLLRPIVIGSRVNLHPMAIFFSLLGGVLAVGPVGIMAGPVLLTLLLAVQEIVRERLKEDTGKDVGPALEEAETSPT